jgi:hypothetical protein
MLAATRIDPFIGIKISQRVNCQCSMYLRPENRTEECFRNSYRSSLLHLRRDFVTDHFATSSALTMSVQINDTINKVECERTFPPGEVASQVLTALNSSFIRHRLLIKN